MPEATLLESPKPAKAPSRNGNGPSPTGRKHLDALRHSYAPVLGRDSGFQVLRHNLARILFVGILSKGFIWVCVATWVGYKMINSEKVLPETVYWGYGAHVVLAFFYWAARDQFVDIVDAFGDWMRGIKGAKSGE